MALRFLVDTSVIKRLAQPAVRQVVEGGTSNLLHLHSDHLGSNSVMSYNNEGGMVGGSRARYLPLRQACIE